MRRKLGRRRVVLVGREVVLRLEIDTVGRVVDMECTRYTCTRMRLRGTSSGDALKWRKSVKLLSLGTKAELP